MKAQGKSPRHEMSCDAIEGRMHDLMDSRQPLLGDHDIQQHISSCDNCAELVVDFGALEDSLSRVPAATLHRLCELGQTEPAQHRRRWWTLDQKHQPVAFFISVASLLLVMLTASASWTRPGTPNEFVISPAPEMASTDVAEDAMGELDSPDPAQTTSSGIFDGRTLVSLDQIAHQIEPLNGYLNLTGDLPGIRPVRQSVHATYQLIRESIEDPSSKSGNPEDPDAAAIQSLTFFVCA